jgi:Transglutaminase-like superfamily
VTTPAADDRRPLTARARAFLAFVATPADAALLARMFAWRVCLPVLKYVLPLPQLVRLMSARAGRSQRARERRIAAMTAWLYRPAGILAADENCLERSLLTYRYLGRAGAEPTLVVGMRRGSAPVPRGHVWVMVDRRPVAETHGSLEPFVPVVSFNARGRARACGEPHP